MNLKKKRKFTKIVLGKVYTGSLLMLDVNTLLHVFVELYLEMYNKYFVFKCYVVLHRRSTATCVQKLVIRNHQFMIAQRLVVRQCCGCFSAISCTELSWVGGQVVFMQLQNHVWSFGLLGCDPWVYCESWWYAL